MGAPDFIVKAVKIALAISEKYERLYPVLFLGMRCLSLLGCS